MLLILPVCLINGWPMGSPEEASQQRMVLPSEPEKTREPLEENAREYTTSLCPLKGSPMQDLFSTSHKRTVLSSPPDARRVPSGENAMHSTPPSCPVKGSPSASPVCPAQSRIMDCEEADVMRKASGEKQTLVQLLWPVVGFAIDLPLDGSHKRSVSSHEPATIFVPSGEYAPHVTQLARPLNIRLGS